MVISLSDLAFARAFSFVAGGIIVNTFLEEIPSDHHGRFWAFALGVFLYSVLLIAIYSMKSHVPIFIDH